MKPEDLVKVRRLEEKQAAEWADLGLPKPSSAKTKVTSRKKPTASNHADPYEASMATMPLFFVLAFYLGKNDLVPGTSAPSSRINDTCQSCMKFERSSI